MTTFKRWMATGTWGIVACLLLSVFPVKEYAVAAYGEGTVSTRDPVVCGQGESSHAIAGCFSSDVKRTCCTTYCNAKKGSDRSRADEIFTTCTQSLGCDKDRFTAKDVCDCKVDAWPG